MLGVFHEFIPVIAERRGRTWWSMNFQNMEVLGRNIGGYC